MSEVRHVLGISGGKDSAALAIYLKDKYPNLHIEYYSSDTKCELDETIQFIDRSLLLRTHNDLNCGRRKS